VSLPSLFWTLGPWDLLLRAQQHRDDDGMQLNPADVAAVWRYIRTGIFYSTLLPDPHDYRITFTTNYLNPLLKTTWSPF
jgi:hypothetical protein